MPTSRRRSGRPPLALSFRVASERWTGYVAALRRNLRAAHGHLQPPLAEMSLALVGDARMGELHEQFMGIAGPTDVLTFPLESNARGQVTEGEVVICVSEARRRAREHRVQLEHELLLYALHGMLHLCGYDDRTQRAYNEMHRTEDKILKRLGIGPVFAAADAALPRKMPAGPRPARRQPARRVR